MIDAGEFQTAPGRVPEGALITTEGADVLPAALLGQGPLLIVSASITCPMAAAAAGPLEQLYEQFGDRVTFLTLYTREAHPGEEYPQPESLDRKIAHARAYQQRDRIPWTVAVDGLEGTFHRVLDLKPNAACLFSAAGELVHRVLWVGDTAGLRRGFARLFSGSAAKTSVSESKFLPMVSGLGVLDEVLGAAGAAARRDFFRVVPVAYAVGRSARLFAPLPPLARTVAASAALAALMSAPAWLLWTIVRGV